MLRELRDFQPGDVVRLDGERDHLVIVRQGEMGTVVRPARVADRTFTGWDKRAKEYRRVSFTPKGKSTTLASAALAELIQGVADA